MNENTNSIKSILYNKILSNKKLLSNQWNNFNDTDTRYLLIDDLLPKKICDELFNSFPKDFNGFYKRKSFRESKKTSANLNLYKKNLNEAIYAFQDKKIINLIADITSINNLEADEILYAGGLSLMNKGDFLNPHIDNSHNLSRDKYRRLNLLYYVSPNWEESNGGNFELWDNKVKNKKTIVSRFNRLIIMETNRTSWHSVSKVEKDVIRCCLSNYYFSKNHPSKYSYEYNHVTSFTGRPNEKFRRLYGYLDNFLRNFVSSNFKISRGKKLVNKKIEK